jgi:hypothetical protein
MNFCDTLLNIYICIYIINGTFRILRKALASFVEGDRPKRVMSDPDFDIIINRATFLQDKQDDLQSF